MPSKPGHITSPQAGVADSELKCPTPTPTPTFQNF